MSAAGQPAKPSETTQSYLKAFAELRSAHKNAAFAKDAIRESLFEMARGSGHNDPNGFAEAFLPLFDGVTNSRDYDKVMVNVRAALRPVAQAANREDVQEFQAGQAQGRMEFQAGEGAANRAAAAARQERGIEANMALEELRQKNRLAIERSAAEQDELMRQRRLEADNEKDANRRAAKMSEWRDMDINRFGNLLESLDGVDYAENRDGLFQAALKGMGQFLGTLTPDEFRSIFEAYESYRGGGDAR